MTPNEIEEIKSQAMLDGYMLALERVRLDFQNIYEVTPAPETLALTQTADKLIAIRKQIVCGNPNGMTQ